MQLSGAFQHVVDESSLTTNKLGHINICSLQFLITAMCILAITNVHGDITGISAMSSFRQFFFPDILLFHLNF